jgi:hypothetical protein
MSITPVFAKATTVVTLPGGAQARLRTGDHYPDDDPLVLGHPDLFSSDPRYGLRYTARPAGLDDPPVETATAGPGERRSSSRARS